MTQTRGPNTNEIRMSDKGLEAVPRGGNGKVSGGFGDKKKVILLGALALVAVGVVGYQFLGKSGPTPAAAKAADTPKAPAPAGADAGAVQKALKQLETPEAETRNGDALSVDRVESLVSKFDTYVQERQVPLASLRVNPFRVEPKEQEAVVVIEAQPDPEAEARARRQQILQAARNLKLGAVLIAGTERTAVIGGRLYQVGDIVEGLRIAAIQSDAVTLAYESETVEVRLRPETQTP